MSKISIEGIELTPQAIAEIKAMQSQDNFLIDGNLTDLVDLTYFLIRNRENFNEDVNIDKYLLSLASIRDNISALKK